MDLDTAAASASWTVALRARAILDQRATKKDAVNTALSKLVRLHEHRETIDWIIATDPVADLRDPEVRAAARR
ncbi:MAG: hypothetical protein ACLPR9_18155 [Acidimicrobiales bacterium]|jgi:hypothetical protein